MRVVVGISENYYPTIFIYEDKEKAQEKYEDWSIRNLETKAYERIFFETMEKYNGVWEEELPF